MTRSPRRWVALVGLAIVPLAVVGLFAGALSAVGSDDARVPAAIVNQDEMVQRTQADGTTTPVLAGRLLVTALTGSDSSAGPAGSAFDWQVTGADEAAAALADGEVYAVITIPKDFSASVVSLGSDNPVQAHISLKTDDAHGYLTGPLTDALGGGLAAIFGTQLSQQYIAGLVGGTGAIAGSLNTAADGAGGLDNGAQSLASGLTEAATQTGTAQTGAGALASGLRDYTNGVDRLSSGLSTAASQSAGLQQLPGGVRQYTDGVAQLRDGLSDAAEKSAGLQQLPSGVTQYTAGVAASAEGLRNLLKDDQSLSEPTKAALTEILAGLDRLGEGDKPLIAGAQGAAALQSGVAQSAAGAGQLTQANGALVQGAEGAAALQSGVAQAASGASQLSEASSALVSGADQLAGGLGQLQTGIGSAAGGASQLADGANQLENGLRSGAEQVPDYSSDQVKDISEVAANPVGLTTSRENEVSDVKTIATTLLVPAGLWVGAIATFLVLGGPRRRILASPIGTGRIVGQTLGRAFGLGAIQAVLLVGLLHGALGVAWSSLPATLPFALLIALSFAAIHGALVTVAGRAGYVVSLVFLALQLTATGGLYPVELLSAPFRAISPLLPVTGAVNGMQAIITGSGGGNIVAGAAPLLIWGLLGALATFAAVAHRRSARSLGLIAHAA